MRPEIDTLPLGAVTDVIKSMAAVKEVLIRRKKMRDFAVVVLEYTARQKKLDFPPQRYSLISDLLDLGVMINDHFDVQTFSIPNYQALRTQIVSKDAFLQRQLPLYTVKLRYLEKHRPEPGQVAACIAYREQTNLLSIAINCAAAYHLPLSTFVSSEGNRPGISGNQDMPDWFSVLYATTMAIQVVDDMVGWQGDARMNRPSFFTALGTFPSASESGVSFAERFAFMEDKYKAYLHQASAEDKVFAYPLVALSQAVHATLPSLANLVRKPGFDRYADLILSQRDLHYA